jgi:hypothetical protein
VCASGKIKLFFPQPESVGPPDLLVPYRSNDLALMEVAVSGDGNLLATKHWSIGAADEQSVCKNELHGFKTVQDLRRMQTPAARIITFSELVDRQETVSLVLVLEMLRDLRPDLQQELRTKLRRAFAKSSKRPGVPDYVAKFIASQILLIPPDKRPSGGPN